MNILDLIFNVNMNNQNVLARATCQALLRTHLEV